MTENIFVRAKTENGIAVDDYKPYINGYRIVPKIQIPVRYISSDESTMKCVSWESMDKCKAPDCSWFNHSQVGLR